MCVYIYIHTHTHIYNEILINHKGNMYIFLYISFSGVKNLYFRLCTIGTIIRLAYLGAFVKSERLWRYCGRFRVRNLKALVLLVKPSIR